MPHSKGASPFSPSAGFTGTGGGNRWFVASQAVRKPELLEHREDPELPVEQQYARRMKFRLKRGDYCLRCYLNVQLLGKLSAWTRGEGR